MQIDDAEEADDETEESEHERSILKTCYESNGEVVAASSVGSLRLAFDSLPGYPSGKNGPTEDDVK